MLARNNRPADRVFQFKGLCCLTSVLGIAHREEWSICMGAPIPLSIHSAPAWGSGACAFSHYAREPGRLAKPGGRGRMQFVQSIVARFGLKREAGASPACSSPNSSAASKGCSAQLGSCHLQGQSTAKRAKVMPRGGEHQPPPSPGFKASVRWLAARLRAARLASHAPWHHTHSPSPCRPTHCSMPPVAPAPPTRCSNRRRVTTR